MEANQVKTEEKLEVVGQQESETGSDLQAVRELSALELCLVGGGSGHVYFN